MPPRVSWFHTVQGGSRVTALVYVDRTGQRWYLSGAHISLGGGSSVAQAGSSGRARLCFGLLHGTLDGQGWLGAARHVVAVLLSMAQRGSALQHVVRSIRSGWFRVVQCGSNVQHVYSL